MRQRCDRDAAEMRSRCSASYLGELGGAVWWSEGGTTRDRPRSSETRRTAETFGASRTRSSPSATSSPAPRTALSSRAPRRAPRRRCSSRSSSRSTRSTCRRCTAGSPPRRTPRCSPSSTCARRERGPSRRRMPSGAAAPRQTARRTHLERAECSGEGSAWTGLCVARSWLSARRPGPPCHDRTQRGLCRAQYHVLLGGSSWGPRLTAVSPPAWHIHRLRTCRLRDRVRESLAGRPRSPVPGTPVVTPQDPSS